MKNPELDLQSDRPSRLETFLQKHLGVPIDLSPQNLIMPYHALFQPKCDEFVVGDSSSPDTSKQLTAACDSRSSSTTVMESSSGRPCPMKDEMGSGASGLTTISI
jgi:hypothetical protein